MVDNLTQTQNKIELSNDINVITAEINSYKQIAGTAIFEIGRRLKYVKENDLIHGQWEKWCKEKIYITPQYANRFIKVYEEFGNRKISFDFSTNKIFEIISLPESVNREEFITEPHIIPSTGERKTVDLMTVNELREVKRNLKEKEQALKEAEEKSKKLEQELIAEREKEPEIITEYIEKDTSDLENKIKNFEKEMQKLASNLTKMEGDKKQKTQEYQDLKKQYREVINEKKKLEEYLKSEECKTEKLRKEREQLEHQAYIDIFELQLIADEFLKKASPYLFRQGIKMKKTTLLKNDLLDTIDALEKFNYQLREIIECKNQVINIRESNIIDITKEEQKNECEVIGTTK